MPFRRTSIRATKATGFYSPKRSRVVGSRVVGYDSDALVYINAVEAADGQALEGSVKDAYNTFIVGCKSDGIWNAIKASCIMAGARTLSGALVPLVGVAPSGFNLASGNYNRVTGLKGDGAAMYLSSNRNNNADPQNNKHMSYNGVFTVSTGTYQPIMGSPYDPTSWSALYIDNRTPSGLQPWINGVDYPTGMVPIAQAGFMGATRSSSSTITSRVRSVSYNRSVSSFPPDSGNITVFTVPGDVFSNGFLTFYSIGESLDLALLDARVSGLMVAISGAIS